MDRHHHWYWFALRAIPRLATHKKIALVEQVGLEALFSCDENTLSELGLSALQRASILFPDGDKIEKILLSTINCCDILTYQDEAYPSLLKQIYDPPLVLFTRGNIALLNTPQLAIVGSRNATIYGRETAKSIAQYLSASGLTVTSGLALGVDTNAHCGALEAKGKTIAVVATGLDRVYPARNKTLMGRVLDNNGLLISEFNPGVSPKPGNFPKRNRIISGLSLGVLVVEATIKSGSLISARCALEQNREVFAVPGSINNPQATGCHHLIKQGAKLVEKAADILEELNVIDSFNKLAEDEVVDEKTSTQGLLNDPLLASVGYEATPVDIVVSRSKLPTDEVLTRLTMLELKGLVSSVPGGYLRLN